MSKRNWFPHFHQIFVSQNNNWKHSAWLGLTAPIIVLPQIVFLMAFPVIVDLIMSIWRVIVILVAFPILGLLGRMDSSFLTIEQRQAMIRKQRGLS